MDVSDIPIGTRVIIKHQGRDFPATVVAWEDAYRLWDAVYNKEKDDDPGKRSRSEREDAYRRETWIYYEEEAPYPGDQADMPWILSRSGTSVEIVSEPPTILQCPECGKDFTDYGHYLCRSCA